MEWYPVVMVAMFNFGDVFGRFAPNFHRLRCCPSRFLYIVSVARGVVLCPILVLGAAGTIQSDAFMIVTVILFGFSNGWLGSRCMMEAPTNVPDKDKDTAGSIMVLSLIAGLATGAIVGIPLSRVAPNGYNGTDAMQFAGDVQARPTNVGGGINRRLQLM